eukprot:gnl/MRDRNA2_/MRDRNA2_118543_c0_seq1.p1 gnl/MRDRNA2_/MRDRNA2_118543_c0~~gnl/MRDRNA2_/MRDRNA2_118543_c0_seq1.p1  ORF type:complete len:467 (-),score=109.45 gnl/MRDRNA2_/MRDRNA2_118543_c0_seq1:24-1424(-)
MIRHAEFRRAGQKAEYGEELAKMPEIDVLNLNIISVHQSGRMHRWTVLVHRGARVGHALRAIIQRSHATKDPLDENQVVLAEVLHGKIYRFFDEDMEISRLREGDTLACYEVSNPESFGVGQIISRPWSPDDDEPQSVCGVIVNVRQQSQRMFFKDENDTGADCDLHGVPALFCVKSDCTGAMMHDMIRDLLQKSNESACQPVADFNLFWCKERNNIVSGGTLVPPNANPLPMKRQGRAIDTGQWHSLLAAEWTATDDLPPWTMQQIGEEGTSLEERSLQVFVGFDMPSFVSQFQFLWDERRRLTAENRSLMTWAGGKEERIGKLRTKISNLEKSNVHGPVGRDLNTDATSSSPISPGLAASLAQTQAALSHSQQENERLQEDVLLARKAREDLAQVVMQQRMQIDKLGRELDALQGWRRSVSAEGSTIVGSPTPPPHGSRLSRLSRQDETPEPLAFQTPSPGPDE